MKGFRVDGWIDHKFQKKTWLPVKDTPQDAFCLWEKCMSFLPPWLILKKVVIPCSGFKMNVLFLCRFQKYHPQRDLKGLKNDGFIVSFNHFLVMFKR